MSSAGFVAGWKSQILYISRLNHVILITHLKYYIMMCLDCLRYQKIIPSAKTLAYTFDKYINVYTRYELAYWLADILNNLK